MVPHQAAVGTTASPLWSPLPLLPELPSVMSEYALDKTAIEHSTMTPPPPPFPPLPLPPSPQAQLLPPTHQQQQGAPRAKRVLVASNYQRGPQPALIQRSLAMIHCPRETAAERAKMLACAASATPSASHQNGGASTTSSNAAKSDNTNSATGSSFSSPLAPSATRTTLPPQPATAPGTPTPVAANITSASQDDASSTHVPSLARGTPSPDPKRQRRCGSGEENEDDDVDMCGEQWPKDLPSSLCRTIATNSQSAPSHSRHLGSVNTNGGANSSFEFDASTLTLNESSVRRAATSDGSGSGRESSAGSTRTPTPPPSSHSSRPSSFPSSPSSSTSTDARNLQRHAPRQQQQQQPQQQRQHQPQSWLTAFQRQTTVPRVPNLIFASHSAYASHPHRLLGIFLKHDILHMLQKYQSTIRPFGFLIFLSYMTEQLDDADVELWFRRSTNDIRLLRDNDVAAATCEQVPASASSNGSGDSEQARSLVSRSAHPVPSSPCVDVEESRGRRAIAFMCGTHFPMYRATYLRFDLSPSVAMPYDPLRDFPPVAAVRFFSHKEAVMDIPRWTMSPTLLTDSPLYRPADPTLSGSIASAPEDSSIGSPAVPRERGHAVWCRRVSAASPRSGDGPCACASCGVISCGVVVNRAFETLLGWTQAEIQAMFFADGFASFFRFIHLDAWSAGLPEHLLGMITGGGTHTGFISVRTKTGNLIKCIYQCQGASDKRGENPGMWQAFLPIPVDDGHEA